ncbi:hypothetical protein JHK85_042613 [Glycine max]|nr:hypothetical protein JHK85_042613 [Glycine max]
MEDHLDLPHTPEEEEQHAQDGVPPNPRKDRLYIRIHGRHHESVVIHTHQGQLHQEGLDELEREDFLRPANVPDWRNSLYYNPHKAQLLFGHGFHTGMDRHE